MAFQVEEIMTVAEKWKCLVALLGTNNGKCSLKFVRLEPGNIPVQEFKICSHDFLGRLGMGFS